MQNNSIRNLPIELGELTSLSILNVSKNKLKVLPESIGMLKNLTLLDISHNKAIQLLPKTLGQAQSIEKINLEGLDLSYPPEHIIGGGATVILAFLATECGIDYTPKKLCQQINGRNEQTRRTCLDKDSDIQVSSKSLAHLHVLLLSSWPWFLYIGTQDTAVPVFHPSMGNHLLALRVTETTTSFHPFLLSICHVLC